MGKHEQHDGKDGQWRGDQLLARDKHDAADSGRHRRDDNTESDPK